MNGDSLSEGGEEENEVTLDDVTISSREFAVATNGEVNTNCRDDLELVRQLLDKQKEEVHEVSMEDRRRWRLHTQSTHPLHDMPRLLGKRFGTAHTSQSYCKMLEMLARYPTLLPADAETFSSFHICEAPGHFVLALDRFLACSPELHDWKWSANSLSPYNECVASSDMLLNDCVIAATTSHWCFGDDGTGDITKWDDDYVTTLPQCGQCHLVTADGSLYAQDAPGEQESVVFPLLDAELRIGMRLLKEGGSLVVKMYSIYLEETKRLLLRIIPHFRDVSLFKPMCSKSGNSERYLIAQGFSSAPNEYDDCKLRAALLTAESHFSSLQRVALQANLATFSIISKIELSQFRDKCVSTFLRNIDANRLETLLRPCSIRPASEDETPWRRMFGNNYVQELKDISTPESAIEKLHELFRQMSMEHESNDEEPLEVEWSPDELSFIELPLSDVVGATSSTDTRILHSLFTSPFLLHSARLCPQMEVIDFTSSSQQSEELSITWRGDVVIDCSRVSRRQWFDVLLQLANNIEDVDSLELCWDASGIPLALTRFSVSVMALLTVLFSRIRFSKGKLIAVFDQANYPEDIPQSLPSFLAELARVEKGERSVKSFVPLCMLTALHPDVERFNRMQWSAILAQLREIA